MASRTSLSRQILASAKLYPARLQDASPASRYQKRMASGGSHYNEPSGYLFGEKAGRVKEDWENLFMYGMFGGMAFATVLLLYKPDTSVQTWALVEAKKKLEAEGGLPKYEKSSNEALL